MAAAEAIAEALWLCQLLADIGYVQVGPTPILEDNHGAIKLSNNEYGHRRTEHIDVRYHFIRERVKSKKLALVPCPSEEMIAYVITKSVAKSNLLIHRKFTWITTTRGNVVVPHTFLIKQITYTQFQHPQPPHHRQH